ncbi:ABC transporter permease [Roseiarcaceae bacterium H3SJ34-1]|uniref:ABC transporter permease n=1 Tax=Terripilifer ovatus TaxID=3032367 RepID=UPI003AB97BA1|nr:ABC transporter permease [Roseiarcaceae bacterium H3SJ34-1]
MSSFIQILIGGLLQGGVFAAVALGFSLVYRVTGVINLSQGAFCVLGAMAMYYFEVAFHWPTALAAVLSVLSVAAFGVAVGAATFVPAVARLPVSSTLVLTAGLLTFFEGVALIVWGNQPYALPPFSGQAPVAVGPLRIPTQGLWLAGGIAAMIAALWLLVNRTALGRALQACADNAMAARLMGIDTRRMMLLSFTLAAAIGATSGLLVAPITSLQFDSGGFFTTSGFIAVAIGGMGSFAGSIVGGLVLGIAEQFAAYYVSSLFANTLALLLLMFMLLWRPQGLFASGPVRRLDVRADSLVHRALVRLSGRRALAVGVTLLIVLVAIPQLPLPNDVLSSLTISLILFIAVLGLDVLMGWTGQVSLGQAGFMAVGGYAAAILSTTYEWPPLAGVLAAMAISVVCALALSMVTGRLRGHYLALATLTFGLLIDSLTVGLVDLTGGPSGLVGIPSFAVGAFEFDTTERMFYLALGLSAVLVLLLEGGMRSQFGRALQAVRSDQLAAAALGVNVGWIKVSALCISAALASLAGSLYAFNFHFLSPEMVATPRSFEMIAMLVLGGEGTLLGGLFGALVLTLLPTLVQSLALYKTATTGALLVATFLFMPEGLFGRFAIWLSRLGGAGRTRSSGAAIETTAQ